MCRHIYDWNIVNCNVKQPFHSLTEVKKEEIWLSPSFLGQKPLQIQENPKSNITTQKRHQKIWLSRTNLGRSVGETTATQLVYLDRFKGFQPSH